jgi:hypothetical protein
VLPDGSAFVLTGRRTWSSAVGKHDIYRPYKGVDLFADAYAIEFRPLRGERNSLREFHDAEPDSRHYGQQNGVIYAYTDHAVFRFMTPSGKRGGSVLTVSTDGGRSFSPNRHPNLADGALSSPARQEVFKRFGYYRSRFAVIGDKYLIEITNPLNYEAFLLFSSTDGGQHWEGPQRSESPQVYPMDEVQKWRDQFARDARQREAYKAKGNIGN